MNHFINSVVTITGVWLIGMALLTSTKDTKSAIIFKVIPMFLGLSCLLSALILSGIVNSSF